RRDVEILGELLGPLPPGPHGVEGTVVVQHGEVDGPPVVVGVVDPPRLPVGPERIAGLEDVGAVVAAVSVAGRAVDVPPSADPVELRRPDLAAVVRVVTGLPDHRLGAPVHVLEVGEAADDDPPVVPRRLDQQHRALVGHDPRILSGERLRFGEDVEGAHRYGIHSGRATLSASRARSQPVVRRTHTVTLAWTIRMLSRSERYPARALGQRRLRRSRRTGWRWRSADMASTL